MKDSKKINVGEVKELINKIEDGATSNKTPLSEILRLCLRLGKQLGNSQLSSWALSELNGYKSQDDLPDYRIQPTSVLGHFSGPFQSGLRNAQIPKYVIEEEHQDFLFTNYLMDPVAELEHLSSGDKSQILQNYWSGDIVAYYQRKEIYQDMVLSQAWKILPKSALQGVLDTIRTRVLEFILEIEDELDVKKKSDKEDAEITGNESKKVSQIFHNVIHAGNVSVGNVGDTTQYSINVSPGDLVGLKKFLKKQGLNDELLTELDKALEIDTSATSQPGPATTSWLAKVMIMIGQGVIAVSGNAAGSLIATALMQFLGIKTI